MMVRISDSWFDSHATQYFLSSTSVTGYDYTLGTYSKYNTMFYYIKMYVCIYFVYVYLYIGLYELHAYPRKLGNH